MLKDPLTLSGGREVRLGGALSQVPEVMVRAELAVPRVTGLWGDSTSILLCAWAGAGPWPCLAAPNPPHLP